LSRKAADEQTGGTFLADTDLFFFYLRGGRCEVQAEKVINEASAGQISLKTSSEVYDDAISAIRADADSLGVARSFVSDMRSIPHVAMPTSAEVAEDALALYIEHGGRRRLSYFDSFHVACARRYDLTLLTSDGWIIENSKALDLVVKDLARWRGHSGLEGVVSLGAGGKKGATAVESKKSAQRGEI
jgi:predicted nucleic acid-binding protein